MYDGFLVFESTRPTKATKSPKDLVIGKWNTGEGSMEFANNGVVTIMEYGKTNQVTYELSAIGGSQDSITITINDSDGSSEAAVCKDENTMVIGDTTFECANAGGNE